MSFNKPSKTYQELIQILNRHLLISDENQAIEFLKNALLSLECLLSSFLRCKEFFQADISKIRNPMKHDQLQSIIYNEGELKKDPTISKMEIVQIKRSKEGNKKEQESNLSTILMPLSQSAIAIPNKPQTLKSTQKEIK